MNIGAIDIGGSKTIVGIVDEKGNVLINKKMPTYKDDFKKHFKLTIDVLFELMNELNINKSEIAGLGVVLPGMVSGDVLLYAPAVDWRNIDIVSEYRELTDFDIIKTEGDVNACAVAEAYFGGYSDMLWITVSNGIGGALIINNKLFKGAHDVAGEIGHIKVDYGSKVVCSCGQCGCVEAMASGTGIGKMVIAATEQDESYKKLYIDNNLPLTAEGCAYLARGKEKTSLEIFEKAGMYIGRALCAALNLLDPQRVFIGGGVSLSLELLLPSIRSTLKSLCVEFVADTPIEQTKLGYNAALIGAASLVLAKDMIEE